MFPALVSHERTKEVWLFPLRANGAADWSFREEIIADRKKFKHTSHAEPKALDIPVNLAGATFPLLRVLISFAFVHAYLRIEHSDHFLMGLLLRIVYSF